MHLQKEESNTCIFEAMNGLQSFTGTKNVVIKNNYRSS